MQNDRVSRPGFFRAVSWSGLLFERGRASKNSGISEGGDDALKFDALVSWSDSRGEAQHVHGQVFEVEAGSGVAPVEDLAHEQEQPASRRIERPISFEVESELTAEWFDQIEEDRIPRDTPRPRTARIQWQAVTQKSKTHFAMLGTDRVVERIACVADLGEAVERVGELLILSAAAVSVLVDQSQPPKAEVRRGVELAVGLNARDAGRIAFGKRQGKQAPKVEFVGRGETAGAGDFDRRFLLVAVLVGVVVTRFEDEIFTKRLPGIEWAKRVLDQGQLTKTRRGPPNP